MSSSSRKKSTSQYVEERLSRLESDFVKCADLLEYNDYIDETDHEGFYVIPSAGDGVIGRYRALRDMEDDTPNIIVRKTVYDKLCVADAALKRKSDYKHCQIVVTYGYRSPRIQKALWAATYEEKKLQHPDLTDEELREIAHMEIAFPDVAGHPTGGAVDVTIYNYETSTYLDMGTEIGDFTSKNVYYKSSNISNEARKNRKTLRSIMCEQGGFAPYDGEWWHFCYGDREWACYTARRRSRNEHSSVIQKVLYRQKEIEEISEIAYNDKVKTREHVIDDDPFRVRLAVQKDGRLTDETLSILRQSGISITQDKRGFLAKSSNFPLEVLFVRDDDISNLVDAGVADIGIVGENVYRENRSKSIIRKRLGFGKCFLALAIPKNSDIKTLRDLRGKRIATSYRNLTAEFLKEKQIPDVEIIDISGSVEIAPLIDYADAIVDLVSTGSSLKQNNLEVFFNILNSESILIVNNQSENDSYKRHIIDKLIERIDSYLKAKKYKRVMMNVPKANLAKIVNSITADSTSENYVGEQRTSSRKKSNSTIKVEAPIITPVYGEDNWFSLQTVMKTSDVWDKVEILKAYGACNIVFFGVEGIIN